MKKTDLKSLLKREITERLMKKHRYFSREELCALLSSKHASIQPRTLNRYLVEFKKDGILYDAGRGWYSSVEQSFKLEQRPVKKVIEKLKKKYPLLSFSVWSTEQLKSSAHHMLTRFVVFVYTERDAMSGVYDFLKDIGYEAWMNPRGIEARKFSIGGKTVVIRPAISRDGVSGYFAGIEKILIDLFVEAADLNLMDGDEFQRILKNVLVTGRMDVGSLLNYARRRKLKTNQFIELLESA